ncbi:TfoX/Sxy family protein [Aestuariispira insulae]|uniref:TfoX-like protein n=1 Tax=Aestuariispira insulae TaxID=1461337 RepID=A0A3D9HT62_9PROT|nr:TfoX/Sxy family protein [Aestuariispira insulae]RED52551.1 TfoX-like protein [Aestuariispira insulae]
MAHTLSSLRNIGPSSAALLKEAGIETVADLREMGAADAYGRLKFMFPDRVSLNMLYALNGALADIPWRAITPEMRQVWRRQAGLED